MKFTLQSLRPADVGRAGSSLRLDLSGTVSDDLRALTLYAQRGTDGRPALAISDMIILFARTMRALFQRPGDLAFDPLHARLASPSSVTARDAAMVVLVLRAARARIRLTSENLVDALDLAALAGIDESYVRRLVRGGSLVRLSVAKPRRNKISAQTRGPIEGNSARVMLASRGVVPFSVTP